MYLNSQSLCFLSRNGGEEVRFTDIRGSHSHRSQSSDCDYRQQLLDESTSVQIFSTTRRMEATSWSLRHSLKPGLGQCHQAPQRSGWSSGWSRPALCQWHQHWSMCYMMWGGCISLRQLHMAQGWQLGHCCANWQPACPISSCCQQRQKETKMRPRPPGTLRAPATGGVSTAQQHCTMVRKLLPRAHCQVPSAGTVAGSPTPPLPPSLNRPAGHSAIPYLQSEKLALPM